MKSAFDTLKSNWQPTVDQIASETGIHSILIMESLPDTMKVVCANLGQKVYRAGSEGAKSVQPGCHELYCERVVSTGQPLFVANAADSEEWCANEDLVKFGLGVYMGLPVTVNRKVYGTICALHNNAFDFQTGKPSAIDRLHALQAEVQKELEAAMF